MKYRSKRKKSRNKGYKVSRTKGSSKVKGTKKAFSKIVNGLRKRRK